MWKQNGEKLQMYYSEIPDTSMYVDHRAIDNSDILGETLNICGDKG